jgi:hypothetical protein
MSFNGVLSVVRDFVNLHVNNWPNNASPADIIRKGRDGSGEKREQASTVTLRSFYQQVRGLSSHQDCYIN